MNSIEKRILLIAGIIYAVGIAGFAWEDSRSLFIRLTPWNIAGAFALGLVFQKKWPLNLFISLLCIAVCGFFVEYAGVHTGVIFGRYHYGKTLGPGWESIPFLIGLNWACMVFFTSSLLARYIKNPWAAALAGALLMTGYDFLLEPVAVKLDMWTWEESGIPLRNYIAWFVFSFAFIRIHSMLVRIEPNRIAGSLFIMQAVFFAALRLIL